MTTKKMYAERHNKEKMLLLSLCFGLLLTFMSLNVKANEYLLPQSDSVYLTDVDIAGFSLQKLNYARNGIYARHGRCFRSAELNEYFQTKDWYVGIISPDEFDENSLNDYEKQNGKFLLAAEKKNNSEGYVLDQPGYDITAVEQKRETKEGELTADQVYDALYLYLDENEIDMVSLYRNSGWLMLSEENEDIYIFALRSYTGAYSYYYVDKASGEVYMATRDPITGEMGDAEYLCDLMDYILDETDFGNLTDGVYFASMKSEMRGYPQIAGESFLGTLCEYEIQDGEIIIHGSLNQYYNESQYDSSEEGYLKNGKRIIVCDENTQYFTCGGTGAPVEYTQDGFFQIIQETKDSGLGFIIEIQNGVADSIKISS